MSQEYASPRVEFKLRPDGRMHIARTGEFPAKYTDADGKAAPCTQVVTFADLEALMAEWVERGRTDVLVDIDHESADLDKRTEAVAWLTDFEVDGEGLWARPRWVDASVATSGRYRWTSIEWMTVPASTDASNRRPVRIVAVALTNRPNIPGLAAVANRESTPGPGAAWAGTNNQPSKTMEELKKIAAALGLPETATVDEILAAIDAAKSDKDSLETEVVANRTAIAEQLADKHQVPEAKRRDFVSGFVKNRAAVEAVLGTLPAPAAPAAKQSAAGAIIVNRGCGAPEAAKAAKSEAQKVALIANRASEIKKSCGVSHAEAHRRAVAELGE